MTQHFLKSAASRDFTVNHVAFMSEEEAFEMMIKLRWGGRDQAVCPHCGVIGKHYFRKARKQWRCKDCDGYFSVTTQTPFQDHKLSFKRLLLGMMLFISSANGISHHRLARDLCVQIKTAQVLVGKLREVMCGVKPQEKLSGTIHMDGGYFGGRPRRACIRKKSNAAVTAHAEAQLQKKKNRPVRSPDNWRRWNNKRVILVMRELHKDSAYKGPDYEKPDPKKLGPGAVKTIVTVCTAEHEDITVPFAQTYIKPGSVVLTDENSAYSQFSKWFEHKTVNHSLEFQSLYKVDENQAESYFSRVRRYEKGVSHRIEPKYLMDIATEMAWREDMRRHTNGQKLEELLRALFMHGLSKWWRGYWQGHHRQGEMLWSGTS